MKQAPKKPVPKELKFGIAFCAVALVAAVVIFLVLYNDGSLPQQDGFVITEGDNWIVANTGSISDPKFYKLGELEPLEGFTLDAENVDQLSVKRKQYTYNANDPQQALIESYYVTGVKGPANETAAAAHSNYQLYGANMDISELKQMTLQGMSIDYFTAVMLPVDPVETGEKAPETGADEQEEALQQMLCYVPANHNAVVLVVLTAQVTADTPALNDGQWQGFFEEIFDTITLEEK